MSSQERRPGYGVPHPELAALLAPRTPVTVERIVWPGDLVLDLAAYIPSAPLPAELVTSVRCIVQTGDRVVVCEAPDGLHVWPGGRRRPGERYRETARREVHEETGWLIDERTLRMLGFLHFRFVEARPPDFPYPHPDFLQLVCTAYARDREGDAGTNWTDLEGWEQGHRLLLPAELACIDLSAAQRAFLSLLTSSLGGHEPFGHRGGQ